MTAVPARTGQAWQTTLVATLFTCVGTLPSFAVAANAGAVRSELELSPGQFGAVIAAFGVASLVGVWRSGPLVENLGVRRALVWSSAAVMLALAGIAVIAYDFLLLGAMMVLAGLANGIGQTGSNLALATTPDAGRRGLSFGIKQAAVPSALILAGLVVPLITSRYGWQWSLLPLGLLALVTLMSSARLAGGSARNRPDRVAWRPTRFVAVAAYAGLLASMACSSLSGFFVDSLIVRGMDTSTAALLLTFGGLCCVAGRLTLGHLADRLPVAPHTLAAGAMAVGSTGFVLVAAAGGNGVGLAALAAAVAFAIGWGWPGLLLMASAHQQRFPARSTARLQTGTFTGMLAGPAAFGWLAQHLSYPAAWLICAALLLSAAGLVVIAATLARTG